MANALPPLNIDFSVVLNPATYTDYWTAAIVFVLAFTILRVGKGILSTNLRKIADKTTNKFDDTLVDILDHLGAPFYFCVSLYLSSQFVTLPALASLAIYYIVIITLVYYAVKAGQHFIDFGTNELIEKRKQEDGGEEDVSIIHLANQILKLVLWVFAILLFLSNIGVDVTPLLAGASIGGIAIAFALQNVLTDVFASFSIYFDKPFRVGDFITVGADSGTVKRIGIKTTRLQSLQGEELIISNKQLTESRINNFKRMDKRRGVFTFGVIYQTEIKKLEKIPKIITDIITKNKTAELDRVHFKSFGDSSLDYEVVYYVKSSDYRVFMDIQQEINLEIIHQFQKEGIEFAYPTKTVFLQK